MVEHQYLLYMQLIPTSFLILTYIILVCLLFIAIQLDIITINIDLMTSRKRT